MAFRYANGDIRPLRKSALTSMVESSVVLESHTSGLRTFRLRRGPWVAKLLPIVNAVAVVASHFHHSA